MKSLFRRDPVTGRWTIISPGKELLDRSDRSGAFTPEHRSYCPFCAGREGMTPPSVFTIDPAGQIVSPPDRSLRPGEWSVRVVPNKFPALDPSLGSRASTSGIYDRMEGFGVHEVIIETPDHNSRFGGFSKDHAASVVAAWRDRYRSLGRDSRIRYILLFRNRGVEAGASLEHPHGQVIGLPIIPKLVAEEIEGGRRYYEWKERCVFCDIITDEIGQGVRVVRESPSFIAIAPYASRFSYELWVLPRKHQAHFGRIDAEIPELGDFLAQLLGRLDEVLDDPPFNMLIHSAPCHEGDLTHYHWHIEIMPRLSRTAGFEWGTGFYLNPVLPEDAARALSERHRGR